MTALIMAPATIKPPPPAPPPPAAAPPPAPPPPQILAPLPEVTIKDAPVHGVPDDGIAPAGRSLSGMMAADLMHDRDVSDEVANGASKLPLPGAPKNFSGAATVTGSTGLQVGTVPVQLFGVKPATRDRCGPGVAASAGDCDSLARKALTERLAAGSISCQVPAPHPGVVIAFAICLDAAGDDLGQFLVAHGLALADTGQTYDYAGAEAAARSLKRGLWAYR